MAYWERKNCARHLSRATGMCRGRMVFLVWLILCSQRSDFTCNCAGVNAKYAYCVHWFLPTSGVACFRRKHISIFYFSVNSAGPWLSSLSSKTTCKLVYTAYCGVHCVYNYTCACMCNVCAYHNVQASTDSMQLSTLLRCDWAPSPLSSPLSTPLESDITAVLSSPLDSEVTTVPPQSRPFSVKEPVPPKPDAVKRCKNHNNSGTRNN